MIVLINYADKKFKTVQKFSTAQAYKVGGVDNVINYGPEDLSEEFREKYNDILQCSRGGGYWLWKPYIILDALMHLNENDYLIYADSGSAIVSNVKPLIKSLKASGLDVMPFHFSEIEKKWSKRDAFIIMECDEPQFTDSYQIEATFIVFKVSDKSKNIVKEWLSYCCDRRILTDDMNVMGKENYPEFIDNRHDQTAWSLTCKKNKLPVFKNPADYTKCNRIYPKSVQKRSKYGQIFEDHIGANCMDAGKLKYRWYIDIWHNIKTRFSPIKSLIFNDNTILEKEPWIS